MKSRSLTLVAVLLLLVAVFFTVMNLKETPETKTTTNEVREVVETKRPRTTPTSSLQEIVVVEYSTKAFLSEGEPEQNDNQ